MSAFIVEIAKRLKDKTDRIETWVNEKKWKPMYLEPGTYTVPPYYYTNNSSEALIRKQKPLK